MKELVLAFGTGVMVGVVFALFKLPIPAPPTLSGILGIIGIFIGYLIIRTLR
ncbi:MAG: XapX domain-containing protein [Candidatus Hodarchaeales archaeon]